LRRELKSTLDELKNYAKNAERFGAPCAAFKRALQHRIDTLRASQSTLLVKLEAVAAQRKRGAALVQDAFARISTLTQTMFTGGHFHGFDPRLLSKVKRMQGSFDDDLHMPLKEPAQRRTSVLTSTELSSSQPGSQQIGTHGSFCVRVPRSQSALAANPRMHKESLIDLNSSATADLKDANVMNASQIIGAFGDASHVPPEVGRVFIPAITQLLPSDTDYQLVASGAIDDLSSPIASIRSGSSSYARMRSKHTPKVAKKLPSLLR